MQLLVFVSSHCSYCPQAVTIVREVVSQYTDHNLSYEKVRAKTERAKKVSGEYNISAYPTIVGLNDDNKMVFNIVGVPDKQKLINEIEKLLGLRKSFFDRIFGGKK